MTTTSDIAKLAAFAPLREQLLSAAREFSGDASHLADLLTRLVEDVARANNEPLEIFPVCHHSPSAAVHLLQRVSSHPPRVIFVELCEDLLPLLGKLEDCTLPVALQAFAGTSDAFPKSWVPLSVVAPLTEFSAEFQAIAFALENPTTELVFVDRSVDHLFQWLPQKEDELEKHVSEEEEQEEQTEEAETSPPPGHGSAVGVQMGKLEPTMEQFHDFLLRNARVRSFAEWWEQYVEQAVIASDYSTYRQVLFLVGSLLRRLGRKNEDHENDRLRERFMWTRMKHYLAKNRIMPEEALYICGAVHAVSDVEEFGTTTDATYDIPALTGTPWLYGMIPSSHSAIDQQFHFPPGTVTLAEASWEKAQRALDLKPFRISKKGKTKSRPTATKPVSSPPRPVVSPQTLLNYLTRPPALGQEDEEQLLSWCVGIVELARKNGYLATTADSIAVYQTSVLLAGMRERRHPSPYDFRDAAITCLEKDRTPKKRNIQRLCEMLLGGDRRGKVGYTALPPLAQNVYTRLEVLKSLDANFNLTSSKIQRALMDLRQRPDLLPVSDLLWKLRYLIPHGKSVRPIMGEKKLGVQPVQESWDIGIGQDQTAVIQLGYEGVTVEHVLEKRLRAKAYAADAGPVDALTAAEDCLLYLQSVRLTEEIGNHAVGLLIQETGASSAPEVFERVRRLVHYYRSTATGLPLWIQHFVTTGYQHYSTLLPQAFADRGTSPDQVAGMLAFLFHLESLALSLGCSRSQLLIAIQQAGHVADDPNKLGLLWAAEWVLGLRTIERIRDFFDELLGNRLALASMPSYVNGFLLALKFTPLVARLVVEIVSRAFERLPDSVLMPWLPGLILSLRPHLDSVLPLLLKEASGCFPATLKALATWQPPWTAAPAPAKPAAKTAQPERSPTEKEVAELLRANPATTNELAVLLGGDAAWSEPKAVAASEGTELSPREKAVRELLTAQPATAAAVAGLLG